MKLEAIASDLGVEKEINSVGDMFDLFEHLVFHLSERPDDPGDGEPAEIGR